MEAYLAICARLPGNELVAGECENLTGGVPDADGLALCRYIEHIPKAAYVNTGLRLIAQGETLEALVEGIAARSFPAEDFRIEYLRLSESHPVQWRQAVVAIANAIRDYPNLDHPRHRFLLVVCESSLWFGEILAESAHAYQLHDSKPYRTSTSLPSRLARAIVNLAVPPAQTILDPCCGTGSILLEAGALGLTASGSDRNWRMVSMARKNLAHFNLDSPVTRADAREITLTADALVTDLPYGRFLRADQDAIRDILLNASRLAPLIVFVAGNDLTTWLQEAGYDQIEVFRVKKHKKVIRYVHRARSLNPLSSAGATKSKTENRQGSQHQ